MTNKAQIVSKKSDKELWELIKLKIKTCDYVFLNHAKARLEERNISDIDVLNILENIGFSKRSRNKSKDKYDLGYKDWNYCIEGYDIDNCKIRIIISFDENLMLIITVIRIDNEEKKP